MAARKETEGATAPTAPAENLADEVEALRAEIAALAERLRRVAEAGAAEGLAGGGRLAGMARAEAAGLEARLAAEAAAHPLRTLGIAALVGLVLGLILRR